MGLNCGASCAKTVLFIFNAIFFLGGAAVLGLGIWLRVNSGSFADVVKTIAPSATDQMITNNPLATNIQYVHILAYVMIAIGSFVFLVAFLGCCGACKEWRPMLVAYAICLIIVMCTEVGVGIAAGVYSSDVETYVRTELQKLVPNYDYQPTTLYSGDKVKVEPDSDLRPENVPATMVWNAVHLMFGCCGINNYNDFFSTVTPYATRSRTTLAPVFCCKYKDITTLQLQDARCYSDPAYRGSMLYSNAATGCVNKVKSLVEANAPVVIGVAVGIGLIELVGIFFAFCLCCAIGDKDRYY